MEDLTVEDLTVEITSDETEWELVKCEVKLSLFLKPQILSVTNVLVQSMKTSSDSRRNYIRIWLTEIQQFDWSVVVV